MPLALSTMVKVKLIEANLLFYTDFLSYFIKTYLKVNVKPC